MGLGEAGGKSLVYHAGFSEPLGGQKENCLFVFHAVADGGQGDGMAQGLVVAGADKHSVQLSAAEQLVGVAGELAAVLKFGGPEDH